MAETTLAPTEAQTNGHLSDFTADGDLVNDSYQVTYTQYQNLRAPGPTPLPPAVVQGMTHPMIYHRTAECRDLVQDVVTKVKAVFQTQNDLLIFPASGTGGWEAAIVNLFSPGDHVLNVATGDFAERFGDVGRAFGLRLEELKFTEGTPADPAVVEEFLRRPENADIKGVTLAQNETSTGVTNDIQALARVIKGMGKVLAVDGVSGMGGISMEIDNWGVDVVLTTTQKTWMTPPGLMMMSVGPDAWKLHKDATLPRYYWDWTKAKKFMDKWETPSTPPLSVMYGLQAALNLMMDEGISNVFARHARLAAMCREGVAALGVTPFCKDPARYSNTVGSFDCPAGLTSGQLAKWMEANYKIIIAGGQGHLKDAIFRIGHMGYVREADIRYVVAALGECLKALRPA